MTGISKPIKTTTISPVYFTAWAIPRIHSDRSLIGNRRYKLLASPWRITSHFYAGLSVASTMCSRRTKIKSGYPAENLVDEATVKRPPSPPCRYR